MLWCNWSSSEARESVFSIHAHYSTILSVAEWQINVFFNILDVKF